MASYGLTRRGIKLLRFLSLVSIGLLIYIRWHDIFPQHPLPFEKARESENSLPHYNEYEHKTVKYLLAANHFHSKKSKTLQCKNALLTHHPYPCRFGVGERHARLCHDGLARPYHQSIVSDSRCFVFHPSATLRTSNFVVTWYKALCLMTTFGTRTVHSTQNIMASKSLRAFLSPLSWAVRWSAVHGPPAIKHHSRFPENSSIKSARIQLSCQQSDINTDDVRFNDDIPASYIFEQWVEKINAIDDPCLMFDSNSSPIFEYWIYGNKKRMLSIWPYLSRSPVSRQWGWSSLVEDAVRRHFHPLESKLPSFLRGISNVFREESSSLAIPGLLAIHIRRGDFKDHCVHLAKWSADWHAFNSFPEFIDKFDPPSDSGWGQASEQTIELYNRRCYPSIEQIVEKVDRVQKEAADPLRHLYIMTNGPTPWVQELKSALAQNMSWDHISSSRDLELTWEQKFVAYAVDMYIAQRAQVFIGNGDSNRTRTDSGKTGFGTCVVTNLTD
ncbi:hypothetical protein JVT61DRAFT_4191 [Boletus reticuloceps]|uniref:Uncharacterized protein n=1 Tax=Boletus reticuloceps TaxID=495285 RepID=A0A8I2YNM1_9AGAM|nr:hypothetical protein JVT61DRAFT_4191 [Boletus reticuloceps]